MDRYSKVQFRTLRSITLEKDKAFEYSISENAFLDVHPRLCSDNKLRFKISGQDDTTCTVLYEARGHPYLRPREGLEAA